MTCMISWVQFCHQEVAQNCEQLVIISSALLLKLPNKHAIQRQCAPYENQRANPPSF